MSVIIAIFNIGPIELLIMAAAAVMLFGGDLPATARKAARTVGRLRALAAELGREFSAEEQLPRRDDIGIDLKQLAKLEDGPLDTRPGLPGRREDEPIPGPDTGGASPPDTEGPLPAWRHSLGSEIPEPDGTGSDTHDPEGGRQVGDLESEGGGTDDREEPTREG